MRDASCVDIADPLDPRIADYRNLPDPDLLATHGIFIAEGRLIVRRLLTGRRFAVRSVMVTKTALDALADALATPICPIYVVTQPVMNTIVGFDLHRGCLAVGERRADDDWRRVAARADLLVVLERVGNPDNVGAIFRNAAAFGAGGVLLGPHCADPLYRKAIRTSMGAALAIPFARATPWPSALAELGRLGFRTIGLTPAGGAPPLAAVLDRPDRTAVVVGHEGEGLTDKAKAACTDLARIPMPDDVDSLNVATAAAIALYELTRGHEDRRPER